MLLLGEGIVFRVPQAEVLERLGVVSFAGQLLARQSVEIVVAFQFIVCWGGVMPDDILSGDIRMFRTTRIWLVAGSRDEFATPERLNDTASTMRRVGLQVTQLSFDGGHRLDDETLVRLATAHTIDGRSTPGSSVAAGPQNRTVTPNQQPDQGGGG